MALQQTATPITKSHDEHILVVKRNTLFKTQAAWTGLKKVNFDNYLAIINANKEFLPRSLMEQDPHYKQIIPYLVFEHQDRYFLMQRTAQATETRLQNKYSLGIGGHIRQEDMSTDSLFDWARREFHEEVEYTNDFEIEPLGILNDDSNDVGKVHLGFVFLLRGKTANIQIKSELKSGQLLTIAECKPFFGAMETWSQMVLQFLETTNK
jgi:predicted NUDIX family phosphoesterase